jgi:1,4-dihydroxy-2-naphthoate octaprenyltransferase
VSTTSLSVWIEASRPKTLWAAVAPVVLGIAIAAARDVLHVTAAALALIGAVLIQVGTNFFNDYADYHKGADDVDRTGPRRVVQAGLVSPDAMLRATAFVFTLAVASGVYLMIRGGWPIVLIGVSSIFFGVLYTGGRFSLAYRGVADLFVLVFFGPVAVAGTYYVQALDWPPEIWLAGLGPGFLAVSILLVNNIRDVSEDARAGKRTLVVRLGRASGLRLYAGCQTLALVVPPVVVVAFGVTTGVLVTLVAALPIAATTRRLYLSPDDAGPALNPLLAATARNLLVYSVLFSAGWLLGT